MGWPVKKIHFIYLLWILSLVLLFPLLLSLGIYTRKTALRLPEAQGPQSGKYGKGAVRTLSLLMVGESTVAGVGVHSQEQGLVAKTALALSKMAQCDVQWHAVGENGVDIQGTLKRLISQIPQGPYDFIVICLGVNDTTGMTSLSDWQNAITELIQRLQKDHPTAAIFLSGLPPMEKFTALPQPLRFVLGLRAKLLDHTLHAHPGNHQEFQTISVEPLLEKDYLAIDGYHPSELGYQIWGEKIAQALVAY